MKNKIGKLIMYFLLICIGYIYLKPIIEMVSNALMSEADIVDPAVSWIPRQPTLNNFKVAAKVLNIPKSMITSILFSASMAGLQTVVSALTGYALSRFTFQGKKFWFMMILFSFIMPVTVLMIPRMMIFVGIRSVFGIKTLGSALPQAILAALGQGINGTILILIFWNFFNMIPHSLDEAAMIDGAGSLRVFWHVGIRLSVSTVLIVFLFAFVWNWNETYQATSYQGGTLELLPLKLASFDASFSGEAGAANLRINEAYKMAATLISIAPLLILYGFVQKQFIQGIENTGITGE